MGGVPQEKAKGHGHINIAGLMGGPKIGSRERTSLGGHHTPVLWLSSPLGPVLSSLRLEAINAKAKLGKVPLDHRSLVSHLPLGHDLCKLTQWIPPEKSFETSGFSK